MSIDNAPSLDRFEKASFNFEHSKFDSQGSVKQKKEFFI